MGYYFSKGRRSAKRTFWVVERFISFVYICHPDESDVRHPQRPKPPAEGVGGRDLHREMPHAVFDGLA